ncbi:MAG: hypothetical protein AAFU79_03525 [Myxococcota bacterium]
MPGEPLRDYVGALHRIQRIAPDALTEDALAAHMYSPNLAGRHYLAELRALLATPKAKRAKNYSTMVGNALEQVALTACFGLAGYRTLQSFQSAGPQYDLLIDGDTALWEGLISFVHSRQRRGSRILIECKARLDSPVSDSEVSRLADLMSLNITSAGLGVFFCPAGITGRKGRSLSDGSLRQHLVLAKRNTPIIVIDNDDLDNIFQVGGFPTLLRRKIQELEEHFASSPVGELRKVDLPRHLEESLEKCAEHSESKDTPENE